MSQVHNDIVKNIEEQGAVYAWYRLRKLNKTKDECYKLMEEISFYIEPEAVEKAEKWIDNDKKFIGSLNKFFGF